MNCCTKFYYDPDIVPEQYKNEKHYEIEKKLFQSPKFTSNIEEANVIFVVGGDGSLIKAIHKYFDKDITFIGLGAGTKNFLMNEFNSVVCHNHFETIDSETIQVEVNNEIYHATNDIIIGSGLTGWINYTVESEDPSINDKFWGTGVVVSTPIGSTAWNRNNYGVVLPLDYELWSMTGIGTDKVVNKLIKPQDIMFDVHSRNRYHINIYIDGEFIVVKDVDKFKITQGKKIKLGFYDLKNFMAKRLSRN